MDTILNLILILSKIEAFFHGDCYSAQKVSRYSLYRTSPCINFRLSGGGVKALPKRPVDSSEAHPWLSLLILYRKSRYVMSDGDVAWAVASLRHSHVVPLTLPKSRMDR